MLNTQAIERVGINDLAFAGGRCLRQQPVARVVAVQDLGGRRDLVAVAGQGGVRLALGIPVEIAGGVIRVQRRPGFRLDALAQPLVGVVHELPRGADRLAGIRSLAGDRRRLAERGLAPKLQQLERISQLPKARQRVVSEVLDSLLAQGGH